MFRNVEQLQTLIMLTDFLVDEVCELGPTKMLITPSEISIELVLNHPVLDRLPRVPLTGVKHNRYDSFSLFPIL